jgi:hypothetical protein
LADYFKRLIPKNAGKHKDIIQRISNSLQTEDDINEFSLLINDVYSEAYTKALLHCKERLQKSGISFNIYEETSNPQN